MPTGVFDYFKRRRRRRNRRNRRNRKKHKKQKRSRRQRRRSAEQGRVRWTEDMWEWAWHRDTWTRDTTGLRGSARTCPNTGRPSLRPFSSLRRARFCSLQEPMCSEVERRSAALLCWSSARYAFFLGAMHLGYCMGHTPGGRDTNLAKCRHTMIDNATQTNQRWRRNKKK